jgi:hypothetical protein
MVFHLTIPEIDSKPSNTKDAVISLLTSEWPLTLREIFFRSRKKYGYSHSYQAVYKAVKELLEKNVLVEHNKKYSINVEWVKKVQSFTDIVETNYYAKDKIHNISGLNDSKLAEDIIILNFDSIFDAEKYLYYFMKYNLLKSKADSICYSSNIEWRPLFYLRAEYNYYSRLIKKGHEFFFLCSGKSKLEETFAQLYKSLGIKFKFINEKLSNDSLVFGDFCISIFIPEEIKIKLRSLINSDYGKDFVANLTEILAFKSNIKIIINKDSELAKEMKKQVISRFKK